MADENQQGAEGQGQGETAFAGGIGEPAAYFSERGDAIALITVTDVERGWQDYGE